MKREVSAGVDFLKRLAVAHGKLDEAKADVFGEKLQKILLDKYHGHWYPESPSRGQAYRCIQMNRGAVCGLIQKACEESELTPNELRLPDVTLWIDPLEVCARSGENSRPFMIASFEEEDKDSEKEEQEDCASQETSDYHSATSSDCGSAASSDTEEEVKDEEKEEDKKEATKKEPEVDTYTITMVPRIRKRPGDRANKTKYGRNMLPASHQYIYHSAPVWVQYQEAAPVFLNTVCVPPAQPPPSQQVYGYYILSQPSPQFILPQASLHP